MAIFVLIVGLLLFIGLVVIHEFGHFVMARRNGVEVEEFGIFFPPAVYKRKTKAGWIFSINVIPLGGFVKLKGEHDSDSEKGSFGAASVWSKTKIMIAGVFMNLVAAFVLLTLLALIGMPQLIPNQFTVKSDSHLVSQQVIIGQVESGSPAAKAGLKAEDVLNDISLPGYSPVAINDYSKLPDVTKAFAGKKVIIYYQRGGKQYQATTTLRSNGKNGYLGVVPTQLDIQRSTWSAPVVAVGLIGQATALTAQGLVHAIGGLGSIVAGAVTGNTVARQHGQANASAQVAGPVGIIVILKDSSLLGYQFMLFIIAIISLTLAIMNILPIPALDGGRLWLMLISRAFKRPLSASAEEAVNIAGFVLLFGLIILVTLADVNRFL